MNDIKELATSGVVGGVECGKSIGGIVSFEGAAIGAAVGAIVAGTAVLVALANKD